MKTNNVYVTLRDKKYLLTEELIDSISKCIIGDIENYGAYVFDDMMQNAINRICKQYYNKNEYDIEKTATLESVVYNELKLIIYSELRICIKNGLNIYVQNVEAKKYPTASVKNDFNAEMLGMMSTIVKKDSYHMTVSIWSGGNFEINICDAELPTLKIVVEFWEINKCLNIEGVKPIELL